MMVGGGGGGRGYGGALMFEGFVESSNRRVQGFVGFRVLSALRG